MHGFFRKRLLQKRFIALAAAYAFVLAGLFANLSGAQMAAAAATQPDFVLCHNDGADNPAPSPDDGTSKTCIDDCCTGCLTLSAALPQPPATADCAAVVGRRTHRAACGRCSLFPDRGLYIASFARTSIDGVI